MFQPLSDKPYRGISWKLVWMWTSHSKEPFKRKKRIEFILVSYKVKRQLTTYALKMLDWDTLIILNSHFNSKKSQCTDSLESSSVKIQFPSRQLSYTVQLQTIHPVIISARAKSLSRWLSSFTQYTVHSEWNHPTDS